MVAPVADFKEATYCAWRWAPLGYQVVYLFDEKTLGQNDPEKLKQQGILEDFVVATEYYGWYASVNFLMKHCVHNKNAEWVVCVGADMDPDSKKTAEQIGLENSDHFKGTNGIVQPTGDLWDIKNGLCAAERICGSPWVGKEFIELCDGKVFCEDFFHYYSDELLRNYALKDDILWQRKDITHLHRHPNRERRQKPNYLGKSWGADERLFNKIKDSWIPEWRKKI